MTTKTDKPSKEDQAEEFRKRVEADFDPNETARERLERLSRETKELEAQVAAEEAENAAKAVESLVREIVKSLQDQNPRKIVRALTIRYAMPGDEVPQIVEKIEPGTPGIVVSFKAVKPRPPKA